MGLNLSKTYIAFAYFAIAISPWIKPVLKGYRSVRGYLVGKRLMHASWSNPVKRQPRRRRLTDPNLNLLFPPPPTSRPTSKGSKTPKGLATPAEQMSLFLTKLTPALRAMIYKEIIQGNTFHISSAGSRAPPRKFDCLRPAQPMDMVHGACYGFHEPGHLLALPLTCRWIYAETMPMLYTSNRFDFSQRGCFLQFLNMLPNHHHEIIRHLQYWYTVEDDLVSNKALARREWSSFLTFIASTFKNPDLEFCLSLSFIGGASTRVRETKSADTMVWLAPLWKLSEKLHLKLYVPSGDSGAYGHGKVPSTTQMSVVIDFREVKDAVHVEPELQHRAEVLRVVHERIQAALWEWRPYGQLIK